MSLKGFNLLKEQIEPQTMWTKIYDWIVGTARIIIIFVEILVVVAFGVRLAIDGRSKKLDQIVEEKERNLGYYEIAQNRFLTIQDKVSAFELSWNESVIFADIYKEINSYLPQNPQSISIKLTKDSLFISGEAKVNEIGKLESSFKNSTTFKNVELVQIQSQGSSPNSLAEFSLRSELRSPLTRTLFSS